MVADSLKNLTNLFFDTVMSCIAADHLISRADLRIRPAAQEQEPKNGAMIGAQVHVCIHEPQFHIANSSRRNALLGNERKTKLAGERHQARQSLA